MKLNYWDLIVLADFPYKDSEVQSSDRFMGFFSYLTYLDLIDRYQGISLFTDCTFKACRFEEKGETLTDVEETFDEKKDFYGAVEEIVVSIYRWHE